MVAGSEDGEDTALNSAGFGPLRLPAPTAIRTATAAIIRTLTAGTTHPSQCIRLYQGRDEVVVVEEEKKKKKKH